MKKKIIILQLILSSLLSAEDILDKIEKNANFLNPRETVNHVLKNRKSKNTPHYEKISKYDDYDLEKISEYKICTYKVKNHTIQAEFTKRDNAWFLIKEIVNEKPSEAKKSKKFDYYSADNCFFEYMENLRKKYGGQISLSGNKYKITNAILIKSEVNDRATFILEKIRPSKTDYRSGLAIKSISVQHNVAKNKTDKKDKSTPSSEGFFLNELLFSNNKNESDIPTLIHLKCNKYDEYIRLSFEFDRDVTISSLIKSTMPETVEYHLNADSVDLNICTNFIKIDYAYDDKKFKIIITDKNSIPKSTYGIGKNKKVSFIDYHLSKPKKKFELKGL